MKTIEQEAEEYLKANCKYDSLTGFYERVEPEDLIKFTQVKILQAQIDILDSLFDLGLKDVRQTLKTPVEIYNDIINPLKKELYKQLKELE